MVLVLGSKYLPTYNNEELFDLGPKPETPH
jgi:hypothetical protein